jgi:iron-sulfur cluster assembly accessory protein
MPADEGEMAVSTDIQTIQITDSAATKVVELLQRELANAGLAEQAADYALRVQVQPGGCAGLRYALYFDDRKLDGDEVTVVNGLEIRVDKMSAPYLRGAQIDYLDTLEQSGFTINNPNAKGSCACGESAHF